MTFMPLAEWLERKASGPKPKRPIPRRTKKRAKQDRQYNARVKVWLELPENRWCQVWLAKRGLTSVDVDEIGMAGWIDDGARVAARCPRSTQCHHKDHRTGARLLDETLWCAVSDDGHRWIHANPKQAREIGVLI